MQLQNGGLYETRDGRRFRVEKGSNGIFTCKSSFPGEWDGYGKCSSRRQQDNLVHRVDEYRLVPVPRRNVPNSVTAEFVHIGKHWFEIVSVEEAKRRFPGGSKPQQATVAKTQTPQQASQPKKSDRMSGQIYLDSDRWISWATDANGNVRFAASNGVQIHFTF